MGTNPYESPQVQAARQLTPNEQRLAALNSVRIALMILLVPAFYNFVCFNFSFDTSQAPLAISGLFRTINSLGLLLTAASIWFLGLSACEWITTGIHAIVARKSKLEDWKESLYQILGRAPFLAVPGAVLWVVWVLAFYQLQVDFYTLSLPIGIAAHVLAACLYIPLFYRWYQLECAPLRQAT